MTERPHDPMTYRDAGVDIDAQDEALSRIKQHVAATRTAGVLSELGSFGGLFRVPSDVPEPVLVSSTDGVGTKLLVAQRAGRHHTVGQCLVNHCVNDILVMGARPLFFLDYFAVSKLDPHVAERVVAGVAEACRENECALVGGETAELPEVYKPGEYDLAGTIVGIVSRTQILDGSKVRAGHVALGLASTGLHTNGYSLARRIVFDRLSLAIDDPFPSLGISVADALLAVHKSYRASLCHPASEGWIAALAHITGGGLTDNVPRVLPEGLALEIDLASWPLPGLFRALMRAGEVPQDDMLRTFNNGIGMVAIVAPEDAALVADHLRGAGETVYTIGRVIPGQRSVVYRGQLA